MNTKTSNIKDDLTIESIIHAFRSNFICAIRRNRNDTFSAGQLSACLLEQFSGFLYDAPANVRIEQFVATYMEPYSDLGLYDVLRNCLDDRHIEVLASVMLGIPGRLLPNGQVGLDPYMVIEIFTNDLQDAVKKAVQDLRRDEQKKQHALSWVRDHPVYMPRWISLYTEKQQFRLVEYYTPLLKKQHLFSTGSSFSFAFNFADGGYEITVCIEKYGDREEDARVPLVVFIELLGLKSPEDVLSEEETI